MFLSADLVGSTGFKQSPRFPLQLEADEADVPPGPHWLASITDFYTDFGAEFARQWRLFADSADKAPKWPMGPSPEFWKGIGDEVVYVKELRDPKEVAGTVWVWMLSVQKYRSALKAKHPALDIKATAWIGGFPVNNSEVVFDLHLASAEMPADDPRLSHFQKLEQYYASNAGSAKYVRDFIGTSIDTGFRLSTKSTPRRMTVSIEVVLMITSTPPPKNKFGPIRIYFEGYDTFKGVLAGKPYPVFWIDLYQTADDQLLAAAEDALLKRIPGEEAKLREFCDRFIAANSQHLIRPFIHDCNDESFKELPANYLEKLSEWNDRIRKERERYSTETSLDEAPPEPGRKGVATRTPESILSLWRSKVELSPGAEKKRPTSVRQRPGPGRQTRAKKRH